MKARFLFFAAAFALAFTLFSCGKEALPSPSSSATANAVTSLSLAGQTWELTQYRETGANTVFTASDQLVFTDDAHYSYNGISGTYSLYQNDGDAVLHLVLNTTPFGNLSGIVPANFQTSGTISDVHFSATAGAAVKEYQLWMNRE